ncbi:MAG TPA: M67 family metallopeptidase [Phycisphaerae bacterium]|nr:M67 family metallopeptidase [Phycisphaerae bacterium]
MGVLRIADELRQQMRACASAEYPRECCGILVGRVDGEDVDVVQVIAASNVAEGARLRDRYTIEPLAIVRADRAARGGGMEIVGYYHSHPDHPAVPSKTDRELAWEGYVYVIVQSGAEGGGDLRAWRMGDEGAFVEVPLA